MSAESRFDNFFITIVQETGGIEGLFHSLFSFLLRRTDYYYEMSPGDKMGFPPGDAELMLAQTFKIYQNEYWKKIPKKTREEYEKEVQKQQSKQKLSPQPKVIPKIEESKKDPALVKEEEEKVEKKTPPSQTEVTPQKISEISTYNGGKTAKYSWSQTVTDLTVQIPLPRETRSKDLTVNLESDSILISLDGKEIIAGEFYSDIKDEDSTWSLEDSRVIILSLEKGTETIWKTIIKGDEEIDATKVENVKDIADFDSETQGALRKIVHDQKMKSMGLPTSEEEKNLDLMKKAWDAEGSPFKGTPFDPSKLKLN